MFPVLIPVHIRTTWIQSRFSGRTLPVTGTRLLLVTITGQAGAATHRDRHGGRRQSSAEQTPWGRSTIARIGGVESGQGKSSGAD
jgi:hypothetical protein